MGNMPYQPDEIATQIMAGFLIFGIVFGIIVSLVFYIFNAIALYSISKKRGYNNAWIAFIPIVNFYLMGAIADNINLSINKKTGFRYLLLIFSGASSVFQVMKSFVFVKSVEDISLFIEDPTQYAGAFTAMSALSGFSGLIGIGFLVVLGFVLYRIYMDYSPNSAVVFLIFSLLFRLYPFFLFAIRNKPSVSMFYANQQPQAEQQYYQPSFPHDQQNNNDNNDGANQF